MKFPIYSLALAALLALPAYGAEKTGENQAEWPQNWQVSDQLAIGRESTPTLSPATVAATPPRP